MLLKIINILLNKRIIWKVGIFILTFSYLTNRTLDPDFGWHLAYGKYIIEHRSFLENDIFSWTMQGYSWYSISWIYDLMVYFLYQKFGFSIFPLLEGLIVTLSFYFLVMPYRLSFFWEVVIAQIYIFFLTSIAGAGLRVQLFEILFLSILNLILFNINIKGNLKNLFFFPVLMILWVNIHGSFLVGLFVITLYIFTFLINAYIKKRLNFKLFVPYLISLVLTIISVIINPYSYKILYQLLDYLPSKRIPGIAEWFPVSTFSDQWLVLIVWTSIILWYIFKKRRSVNGLFDGVVILVFSYLAFKSRRMIAPYFVVSLPTILSIISKKRFHINSKLINIPVVFLLLAILLKGLFNRLPNEKLYSNSLADYCLMGPECSVDASKYIKKHPLPPRSFTSYNFGGFTIWQNPESKIFVDGRMDQWNKKGYSAFKDHQRITHENDFELFEKYNFNAVYIHSGLDLANYLKTLVKKGDWKIAFEDNNASIFIKIKK